MEKRSLSVFLIGESVRGSSLLASMDKRGCECSLATSCREAFLFLRNREFDLVLGPMRLPDGALYPIMSLLEGSRTTVFYFCAVEQGCWWLPALRRGQKCFGSPALRGDEFVNLLDEMTKQIRGNTLAAAEKQPPLILPARVSTVPASPAKIARRDARPGEAQSRRLAKPARETPVSRAYRI